MKSIKKKLTKEHKNNVTISQFDNEKYFFRALPDVPGATIWTLNLIAQKTIQTDVRQAIF